MGSRASLNKVLLIGNLTRDPELRYTPSGAAVCSFGLATNRYYVASDGTKKEETEFMKIVAWNKLAELCSQLLSRGRKVYVEGRLQTRSWETPDGQPRQTTEIVIDDMRILDSRRDLVAAGEGELSRDLSGEVVAPAGPEPQISGEEKQSPPEGPKQAKAKKAGEKSKVSEEDEVNLDDLPF